MFHKSDAKAWNLNLKWVKWVEGPGVRHLFFWCGSQESRKFMELAGAAASWFGRWIPNHNGSSSTLRGTVLWCRFRIHCWTFSIESVIWFPPNSISHLTHQYSATKWWLTELINKRENMPRKHCENSLSQNFPDWSENISDLRILAIWEIFK